MIATDDIKARFNLAEFVNGYVSLAPAGNGRYRACCPFHDEGTPSFYVFEKTGAFKCFGCGASGDLIAFVQKIEGVGFKEAAQKLNRGEVLAPLPPRVLQRAPVKPETTWRQEIARANVQPLRGSAGERYLQKRGIPVDIACASRVKYATAWYGRASVLFPIVGQDGQTLAVQGRAISGSAKITKGPKSLGVFATKGALENGLLAPAVAICEAPIDALSVLVLQGIPAIATCGSGLPAWVPQAARGTVWIASDNDKQGDADYLEWGALLENHASKVRRLKPLCKDWNEELIRSLQPH